MPVNPFDLADEAAYRTWRERKLAHAPRRIEDIIVEVNDPRHLSRAERARLLELCANCNMAIYAGKTGNDADKAIPRQLGLQLGLVRLDAHWLTDEDGISPLSVRGAEERGERREFIPYTDKPIRWHTDGYYNPPERAIRSLILHCVQDAAEGGDNRLFDHELVWLLLRDEDPAHIAALMAPDAMTIPERVDEDGVQRPAQCGPVFSIDETGHLHMRYTARTVSIAWKEDTATVAARQALERLLAQPEPWVLQGRLTPGMGLVCNNVLHDRSGFRETPEKRRLLYRARYYDRIVAA